MCRGRILGLHPFEILFELVGSHIVEAAKLVNLPQCELGLAQITQLRLAIVLAHILICSWNILIKFIEDHVDI